MKFLWRYYYDDPKLDGIVIPKHVGIIMDGNGRWAKKSGLPRSVGHRFGAQNFRKITRYISKVGVKVLTLYAFQLKTGKDLRKRSAL